KSKVVYFFSFQSTTKSHSLGANVQTVLSLMKAHNPALCNAAARRAQKRHTQSAGSASTSDSDNAFDELLLGLQDEFGHITFEHRELSRQIQESDDPRIQEDLRRELENLEARMEAKGEQIAMVRRQQQKVKRQRKQQKTRTAARPNSASAVLPASGGEVQVITTVKTKAAKTTRPGEGAKTTLTALKGMKTLQNSLGKNQYHWD
ncbi:centrosomal protein of 57 kDa-like, partial [Orbicella faveolata]|uniref:centrosomal protein of 57 kDa-like n=1 Tax=Orbicella faveolata TaxID=48498 RepID=UPI0009E1B933